jgi:dCMP deaminase
VIVRVVGCGAEDRAGAVEALRVLGFDELGPWDWPLEGRNYVLDGGGDHDSSLDLRPGVSRLFLGRDVAPGDGEALAAWVAERAKAVPRPAWDEYFMQIARIVARRSNCVRRSVAAVVVRDRRIVCTGYNGTPRGARNCNDGGCARCASGAPSGTSLDTCLCSHAEENAITQAAYHGTCLRDATIYTTCSPCLQCTKMIINAGIREVVYDTGYPMSDESLRLLSECGVNARRLG